MEQMGEKTRARSVMQAADVPVVPGSEALGNGAEAANFAAEIGLPVMVKAAAGGGGKGMRRVDDPEAVERAFEAARSEEARKSFGDDRVYVEKFLQRPRTSRCKFWPISKATAFICLSENAPFRGVTRK